MEAMYTYGKVRFSLILPIPFASKRGTVSSGKFHENVLINENFCSVVKKNEY